MSASDIEQEKARLEQELRILRQIAFASGLFQGDITIRTLLESLAEGVVIIDNSGTILLVNTRAEQMFGYPREDLIGKPHAMLIPERFRKVHEEHQARFFAEPRIRSMGELLDLAGRRGDGSEFPVEISLSFVETINGILVLAFVSDITGRKRAEYELRKSEMKLAHIFHSVPVLIGITTLEEGKCIEINERGLQSLGYTREEIVGRTLRELEIWGDQSTRDRVIQVLEEEGEVRDLEINLRGKAGNLLTGLFSAEPIHIDGERYVLDIVKDITDHKRAEEEIKRLNATLAERAAELEAANLELEAFNFTVAHDLRTPLSVVNGYCQALMELCGDKLENHCADYLREAYEGTWRMNRLIDALLNFSRLARVHPLRETVDLSAMAHEVAAELKLAEPERRVTFLIADGVSAYGDAGMLRVVLDNLLGNAWKYTSQQEEAIIESGVTEIEGKRAYFVRDNGTGFDMAVTEKIFKPFQRLPGTEEFRGHGIGLATVERIISRHGGRIWAEGEPGKGATFYFTLGVK